MKIEYEAKSLSGYGGSARGHVKVVNDSKTVFGFWVYIMTDLVLFATLFATYAVLRDATAGGEGAAQLFSPVYVLTETMVLLTSSFTAGMGLLSAYRGDKKAVLGWFGFTFILGAIFIGLEVNEFKNLALEGHSWAASAYLSSFFTLVGTHGLHVSAGLVWMAVMMRKVWQKGITEVNKTRLTMLSLFWHFLDIVWIFIFSIVFMLGFI